jgi:hypothetical protein
MNRISQRHHPRSAVRRSVPRTVLLGSTAPRCSGFVVHRCYPWDRVLARLHALALDADLASGYPADNDRLHAVRAGMLVEPGSRERLARHWEGLLLRAERPRGANDPRVPLARARILAADEDIRQLVRDLRAGLPVPARGVAMANLLLIDGTGPVYNVRSERDLRMAIRDAIHYLDPSSALEASLLDL